MKKKIKIIDIFCYISTGENEKIPKRVKWRDSIWEYDDRAQDYVYKESMLFEQNKFIRTKEFLNDEVEILDEEDEFEDIEDLSYAKYEQINHDMDKQLYYIKAINKLIKNQRKIISKIERLNNERD